MTFAKNFFVAIIFFTVSSLVFGVPSAGAKYKGLGAKSVSPETIKKFAPTPLDPKLSKKILGHLDLRAPGIGMLTDDGKNLFFTWRISGTSQAWKLDGPMKFPVQMTGGQDSTTISGLSHDGRWVALSRDPNGSENPGVFLQSTEGGTLKTVFQKEGVQGFASHFSENSKFLYYLANDQKPDSYAIYQYEIASGKILPVFNEPGLWQIDDVWKDTLFLLKKSTGSLTGEYFTYSLESKKLTPVLGQNEKVDYDASFSTSSDELIVLTPKFGNFKRLYKYANEHFTPISREMKADVSGFSIDETRSRILYEINDQGYFKNEAMDAKSLKPIDGPKFPEADHVFAGKTTRNGRYTTFGVERPDAPRLAFVYDWSDKKLTQWIVPSSPEIDTHKFVRATLDSFTTHDGTKIPMFVRIPEKCKTELCPVIVHFHGGPEGQSIPGFNVVFQLFIDEGFIFVEPNVRGSEGYGKAYLDSDNGSKRLNVITDIEDCAKEMKIKFAKNGATPKVGILGWSYGGYSTLYAMTKFAGSYDVGVAGVGMSNLVTFLENTAPYRRILRTTEYGDPVKDRAALIDLSPITYINKIKSPLLIFQGVNDPRVPVGEAIQMYEAIKKKHIPSKLILFADEGHGSAKRENQVLEYGHIIEFFNTHLRK